MPEPEIPPPSAAPPERRAMRSRMTGITQARATGEIPAPADWLQEESRLGGEAPPTGEAKDGASRQSIQSGLSAEKRRAWVEARAGKRWRGRRSVATKSTASISGDPSERARLTAPRWLGTLARGALMLGLGAALGFGASRWGVVVPAEPTTTPAPTLRLDPGSPAAEEMEREADLAYAASKAQRHAEARGRFAALRRRFPGQAIFAAEEARCFYYQADYPAARRLLAENLAAGRAVAESHFLLGLVQLAEKRYAEAQESFRRAALADPSRPETHFLWAEALRRAGRAAEAARRYQVAWERNQLETNEVAYRLKLWLAQVAGGGLPEESARQVDAALAARPPSGDALVADAARALQGGDFARAGRRLEEARRTMEPLVFHIALRDPAFLQEAWRPEIAPFYERRP